ncbi:uncharacterized protein LOC8054702 isoform X2 [Sorghum bicolor]|uniref:SOSEKI DIX-like domain-containing protein n=1 Tax=Sorghum bicolor TaxID=4558 RepID=A0A1B6Q6F7_SORBI|nr:uncharacterized protein LOC8054702 isoform X2 [Sorghum bicolor]KXG33504.1 hypothetical protein SORBI_3003G315600 [Sorghum bicolor]|eukprot:XP_021311482.1 uncharacterized protein LOC8054702 isoform X2 [Sorghum bicolor]
MDAHKGAAGGGGEVRRINVVYFLSRGGRTDHPHLFRVNHLNRAGGGVRLRDVKRWLSELRGKDMPDNYSWSYKRKYKAGYVWQDVKDDDLITPVSDNEYVLKGCDARGTPPPSGFQAPRRTSSFGENKRKEEEEEVRTPCNDDQSRPVEVVLTPDSDESSPKPPPPLADQDSPGGCESARRSSTAPFKVEKQPQGLVDEQKQQEQVVIKIEVSRSQNHQRQKHADDDKEDEAATEKKADTKAAAPAPVEEQQQPQGQGQGEAGAGGVSRGHAAHAVGKQARRMRVVRALHNMLTCARADADDAALRPLATRRQDGGGGGYNDWPPTPTCPGMEGCGLRVSRKTARPRKGGDDKQRKRDGEKKHDAHKLATLPRCSQCGKEFKPQELHSHMQSCRGFKERMRSSTSARPSADRRRRNWTAGHYSESERPSSASAVFLLTES